MSSYVTSCTSKDVSARGQMDEIFAFVGSASVLALFKRVSLWVEYRHARVRSMVRVSLGLAFVLCSLFCGYGEGLFVVKVCVPVCAWRCRGPRPRANVDHKSRKGRQRSKTLRFCFCLKQQSVSNVSPCVIVVRGVVGTTSAYDLLSTRDSQTGMS